MRDIHRPPDMKVLPPPSTCIKLFATGATVGPVVDSLHNQCLLRYDVAPISLAWPEFFIANNHQHAVYDYFFCSSWTVPPLLGIAYVILGGILPRLIQSMMISVVVSSCGGALHDHKTVVVSEQEQQQQQPAAVAERNSAVPTAAGTTTTNLRTKAITAVLTTTLIIQLSEFLETHSNHHVLVYDGIVNSSPMVAYDSVVNLMVMLLAAIFQWAILDGTLVALLAASLTSLVGPLSEIPFVAHGFWHYLPQAGDYFPLASMELGNTVAPKWFLWWLLGDNNVNNYQDLALSTITGPCYFAVTMDAIALGRWFDSSHNDDTNI